jgi:hypothetical protein
MILDHWRTKLKVKRLKSQLTELKGKSLSKSPSTAHSIDSTNQGKTDPVVPPEPTSLPKSQEKKV